VGRRASTSIAPVANTESGAMARSLTRRSLLVRGASLVGALGVSACRKGPSFCNDVSALSADQQNTRATLGYEDGSDQPGKSCAKCSQYLEPPSMDQCGKCKVLPGAVHPNGYCRAFTPKA
jgi:hypothetical protein